MERPLLWPCSRKSWKKKDYYDRDINIAAMFNFVKDDQGSAIVSCRIFETWLYNLFISNDKGLSIYQQGESDKNHQKNKKIENQG